MRRTERENTKTRLMGHASALRAEVLQLRTAVRKAMMTKNRNRQALSEETRKALREHRSFILRSLSAIKKFASVTVDTSEPSGLPRGSIPRQVMIPGSDPKRYLQGSDPPSLDEQVLQVIARHPEGIALIEIGNRLGVDWRELIEITHRLQTHGKIEQVQQLFRAIT